MRLLTTPFLREPAGQASSPGAHAADVFSALNQPRAVSLNSLRFLGERVQSPRRRRAAAVNKRARGPRAHPSCRCLVSDSRARRLLARFVERVARVMRLCVCVRRRLSLVWTRSLAPRDAVQNARLRPLRVSLSKAGRADRGVAPSETPRYGSAPSSAFPPATSASLFWLPRYGVR